MLLYEYPCSVTYVVAGSIDSPRLVSSGNVPDARVHPRFVSIVHGFSSIRALPGGVYCVSKLAPSEAGRCCGRARICSRACWRIRTHRSRGLPIVSTGWGQTLIRAAAVMGAGACPSILRLVVFCPRAQRLMRGVTAAVLVGRWSGASDWRRSCWRGSRRPRRWPGGSIFAILVPLSTPTSRSRREW